MCFSFQAHSKWFAGLLITLLVGWSISTRSAAAAAPAEPSSSVEPWGSITLLQRRWSGTMPQIRAQHQRFTTSAAMRKGTQPKKQLWEQDTLTVEGKLWSTISWHQPCIFRRNSAPKIIWENVFTKSQPLSLDQFIGTGFKCFHSDCLVMLLNSRRPPSLCSSPGSTLQCCSETLFSPLLSPALPSQTSGFHRGESQASVPDVSSCSNAGAWWGCWVCFPAAW